MNKQIKKTLAAMFVFSFIFLYAFNTNQASAAAGSQEIEKTFEYICEARLPFPGIDPSYEPRKYTIKASIPERVKPGEEFNLTNVSFTVILPTFNFDDFSLPITFEGPNFKILSENNTNTIHSFYDDTHFEVPSRFDGTLYITIEPEDGKTIGPFIAGDEGEVFLKADEIRYNQVVSFGEVTLSLGLACKPPEDEEFILGTVSIDEAPILTLNGDSTMIVKQGDPYEDPGATAKDDYDGDLTDKIEISGDVDTSTIGTYTVTYTVSDSVGNVVTAERTVKVVEPFGDFYSGEGPPSDSLGSNGDTYLDVETGDVYKRDPNTWTKVGNIKGDDGKQGNVIHTGSGAPKSDAGSIGDLYFDTNSGNVYEKTADGWSKIANLQGPAGPQGPKGADGTGGTSGDSSSKDKKSGAGKSKVTAKGDDDGKGTAAKGGKLPKTATSLPAFILVGALLAAAGGALFLRRRKAIE